MKKILYITSTSSTVKPFLLEHINKLIEYGNKVDIACDIDDKILEDHSIYCDIWNLTFDKNILSKKNLQALKRIRALQEKNKYDIIHVHTRVASFVTRYALKNELVTMIYKIYDSHFYKECASINYIIYYFLEKIAARWTDRIIIVNKKDFDMVKKFKLRSTQDIYLMKDVGINKKN